MQDHTVKIGQKVKLTAEHLAEFGSLYRPHDSDVFTVEAHFHLAVFELTSGKIKRRLVHAKNFEPA